MKFREPFVMDSPTPDRDGDKTPRTPLTVIPEPMRELLPPEYDSEPAVLVGMVKSISPSATAVTGINMHKAMLMRKKRRRFIVHLPW
jgi:hypothetical protein